MRQPHNVERQQSDSTLFLYAYVKDNKLTYNQTIKQINRMKKVLFLAMALLVACSASFAQDAKEIMKERKAIQKLAKSELNEKASKDAKKEAKRMTKDGWQIFPGALPIAKQLDRSYLMQYEYVQNEDGSIVPKYLVGEGIASGTSINGTKNDAIEAAKYFIAGLAEIEITSITELTLANQNGDVVASLEEVVSASKNIVSKRLGEVLPIVTVYREINKHEVEVAVYLVYDRNTVLQTYKEVIREELEKKGDKLHEQLDQALGF